MNWLRRYAEEVGGLAIAALAWAIVVIIAVIATAQSGRPWDTFIAAGAAISQAAFAFMVWRLGKAQYEFTQRVTDRQHKIDLYPLRYQAYQRLLEAGLTNLRRARPILANAITTLETCHFEIKQLFSDQAGNLSFELVQAVITAFDAQGGFRMGEIFDGDVIHRVDVVAMVYHQESADYAIRILTELEDLLQEEMRIAQLRP